MHTTNWRDVICCTDFQVLICLQDLICCEATKGGYLPLGCSSPPLEGVKKLVVRLPRWFVCNSFLGTLKN